MVRSCRRFGSGMCKTVSKLLPLFLLALLWSLPLHADELSEEQIKEMSALWDDAQRLLGEEDYHSALKITEQVLDKLDQWRADEFSLYAWQELEVKILMRDQQYPAASKKQKEILSLTKDLFGDKAPKTLKARAFLSDLDKIAALTPEQQKELSEGEAAYHAAWSKGDLEKTIELGEQMAAKEKQYLGEDCTWYTNSLSLLAGNYIAAKKYEQAEAKYLEGLKITEKLYGQMHLNTAIWCDSLAALYTRQGEYAEAEPLYDRALVVREKALGPDHPMSHLVLIISLISTTTRVSTPRQSRSISGPSTLMKRRLVPIIPMSHLVLIISPCFTATRVSMPRRVRSIRGPLLFAKKPSVPIIPMSHLVLIISPHFILARVSMPRQSRSMIAPLR